MIKTRLQIQYLPALWVASIPYGPSVASVFFVLALISIAIAPPSYEQIRDNIKTGWFLCLMLLTAWIILSLFWSPEWNHETWSNLKKILRFALLPLFIPAFSQPSSQKVAINGFIIGMLVTCLLSFIKWALKLEWYHDTDPGHLFYNHIITGFLCVFAAFCCLNNFFKNQDKKWLYSLAFLILSIEILMINPGRAAYMLYASLWVGMIWHKTPSKYQLRALVLCGLSFMALFQLSPMLKERLHEVFSDIQNIQQGIQSTSLGFRWQFYQFSYQLFQKHIWIGNGLGSYGYYFQMLNPVADWQGPPNPHNQYALIAVEQGLIGLGLTFNLFYQWWKKMSITGQFFIVLLAINGLSDVILNACPGQLFLGIAAMSLMNVAAEKKPAKDVAPLFENNLHLTQPDD